MSARQYQSKHDILRKFIPLNTMSSARFENICDKCHVEECEKGAVLFEQGDDAKEFIYLISGMISLYAGEMEMETIVTGSEVARFAIAHHLPRKVKAVTKSKARIVRIPTHMLDMDSPEDNGQTYLVDEVDEQGGDWMTTMLQSPVFQRLPASNLQKVMMQMEEVAFEPGEVVVKQGDEADFYYIIKSGNCELIRQPSEGARAIKLGELHSCDAFGEDALLSGNPRNVTVQMKGKGQMLRLSKANFIKLVKEPVLQYVNLEEGQEKVNAGANWLDVRSVDMYAEGHIEGSVNIPFFSLRMKIPELRHDQLQVLVCANGRTSEAAAFLLLKFGFNALILKGGMLSWNKSIGGAKAPALTSLDLPSETTVENKGTSGTKQLKEEKNRIMELEKLCAKLNEKLNKFELERDELQKKSDQQSGLVAQLQSSSKLVADELAATHDRNEVRETKLNEELLLERKEKERLAIELESKTLALNKAKQEADDSRESLSLMGADISTKDKELEELKLAFNSAKAREEDVAEEHNQQLVLAKKEIAELSRSNEELKNKVSVSKKEIDEFSQFKAKLEQHKEQLVRERDAANLEKEEQIQLLNTHLFEVRSNLKDAEQLKAELENRQREFDTDLDVLTHELKEKSTELEGYKEEVCELNIKLESLKEEREGSDEAMVKKDADIEAFKHQLEGAEKAFESLKQEKQDLESVVSEKNSLISQLEEKSTSADAEYSTLLEMFEHSKSSFSDLLEEKSALEKKLDQSLQLVDDLGQQKNEAEKALGTSEKALADSNSLIGKLQKESEKLHQQINQAEISLHEVNADKENLESELTNRLADTESDLKTAQTTQQKIEGQLKEELNANEQAQQKITELGSQLERSLSEQQQLNQQLSESKEALDELRQHNEKEVITLTESLQQAESRFEEINTVTNKLTEEKERGIKEYKQRIDELEAELNSIKEVNGELKQTLVSSGSEQQVVQQEMLAMKSQLESAIKEQQQTAEELSQARQQADKDIQEKDAERLELNEALEQLQNDFEASKVSLDEQIEQLEGELVTTKNRHLSSEEKLESALVDNEQLQQKVLDAEKVLTTATGDQKALLAELDKVRLESTEFKQAIELKQSEIDAVEKVKKTLEEELYDTKKLQKESALLAETKDQRCIELTNQLEALKSGQQTEEGLFKEQLMTLENKLQDAEKALQTQMASLEVVEESLSAAVSEKEAVYTELEDLKQASLSDNDTVKASQQKITRLEQSLKQLEEEKEQFIANADKASNEKVDQLTEQLLAAQKETEESLSRLNKMVQSRDAEEKEKAELEEKLELIGSKNRELKRQVADAERKASKAIDSDASEVRIKELEKQLDDVSTMLLDLEIKMETSVTDYSDEPDDEEKNALKALQAELDLVREQTEKDIQAMQAKVENSEKMNLALKKKILSMQTLANQEVVPEEPPKAKKRGWWK